MNDNKRNPSPPLPHPSRDVFKTKTKCHRISYHRGGGTKTKTKQTTSKHTHTHQVDVFLDDLPLPRSPVLDSVILGELSHKRHQGAVFVARDGGEQVVLQLVLHAAPHVPDKNKGGAHTHERIHTQRRGVGGVLTFRNI